MMCSQIWLNPLLKDFQSTYLTNLKKKPWINPVERSEGFFVNFFYFKNWKCFPKKLAKLIEFALQKEKKQRVFFFFFFLGQKSNKTLLRAHTNEFYVMYRH
jgi:hypothetical protein